MGVNFLLLFNLVAELFSVSTMHVRWDNTSDYQDLCARFSFGTLRSQFYR